MMKRCQCGKSPTMITTVTATIRTVRIECKCGKTTGLIAWTKPKDTLEMKEAALAVWDVMAGDYLHRCK